MLQQRSPLLTNTTYLIRYHRIDFVIPSLRGIFSDELFVSPRKIPRKLGMTTCVLSSSTACCSRHSTIILWLLALLLTCSARATPVRTDSITHDYKQAVDYCLFRQYDRAEPALLSIIRQVNHPARQAAIFLLAEEVYLWRGQYTRYVALSDSLGYRGYNYELAQRMRSQPAMVLTLPDSVHQSFRLQKRGHVVVTLFVNGRPKRFLIDTGAQRTMLSTRLAAELGLSTLIDTKVDNSLGQALPSSVALLDSIQFGALQVNHIPVFVQSLWGFNADGALGWDILRQFRITIDYVNRTITLTNPTGPGSPVPNLLGGSRPLLQVQNKTGGYMTLFCDTGDNGQVTLTPQGKAKLTDGQPGHTLSFDLGFGGRLRLRRTNAMKQFTIQADGHAQQLRKQSAELPAEQISSVLIDGRIGSGFFRHGRLTLDPARNQYDYQPIQRP
ncbi:gag-polyprotein putative aspartyl protease [Spirosoma oryzae]|uniref:Gag-polyprotein putative aspartyl protease n=1 Tax=Spirosoma oryzae TaxID=1469603 RepID=A0A2T0S773_9BACT|nr:gag-polyprotein putative aspartyl protease [Spirosoma oryzae]